MAGIGVYTNLVNELYARLNAYSALSSFDIQRGYRANRLQAGDKFIQIEYGNPFIEERYERVRQNQKTADLNLLIWVQYPTLRDNTNKMYETTTTGVIPTIEDILDAMNTTTSAALDPQIANAAKSMAFTVNNVIEHDDKTEFEIAVTISATYFTINDRGNN